MGKLTAIIAASALAAGGAFGLVYHTDVFGPDPVDPAACPVVKVGGCPFCTAGSPAASTDSGAPDACCADAGAVARAAGGDGCAAVAVAGPAGLFTSTAEVTKKACCCAEEPSGLTAVAGAAATAAK
jgi:hypothetical protein